MSTPKKVAYSFVIADMLHYGHIRLLETGRREADHHICGVISDEACAQWQGPGICSFEERSSVIKALSLVDEVMKQDSMDPSTNIKAIKARFPEAEIILVHGDDWKELPGSQYLRSIGGRVVQPEYYERLSRQSIINRIRDLSGEGGPGRDAQRDARGSRGLVENFLVGDIVNYVPEARNDLLSTKADTLRNFRTRLKTCMIEKLFTFIAGDFLAQPDAVLDSLMQSFGATTVVVRSSSLYEDMYESSSAGCFESVIGVDASDRTALHNAITRVLASYDRLQSANPSNQVLVQRQTVDVHMSGVVFTRNLQSNTPYYSINYDDETGQTDSVTGGHAGKSVSILRNLPLEDVPERWQPLIRSIREIEDFLPGMVLDIEFAQKLDNGIVIFQIRPLAANVRFQGSGDRHYYELMHRSLEHYRALGAPLLSDMAFWNPSEIVGDNPHPLDYSLYREIITHRAWNVGLRPMGYRRVNADLMVRMGNKPYIDLEHSFASLTPASLSGPLYRKLSAFYRQRLLSDLAAHDKIEFDIVLNTYFFTIDDRLADLRENGFTAAEVQRIRTALARLTSAVIIRHEDSLAGHARVLEALQENVRRIEARVVRTDYRSCISEALKILQALPAQGTAPFAAVAREAFMAASLGRSLRDAHYVSAEELEAFLGSITTVSSEFDRDFHKTMQGAMPVEKFLHRYGHLRAGTYDINAPRYDTMDINVIRTDQKHADQKHTENRSSRALPQRALTRALAESPLSEVSAKALITFMRSSTRAREQYKFDFTKALSLALELIAHAGEDLGFSRREMCFLEVPDLRASAHYGSSRQAREFFSAIITNRRSAFEEQSHLVLPPVIRNEHDLSVVEAWDAKPNFTTSRVVSADVVNIEEHPDAPVKGKIVLLTKADPGFDWIFTQGIKGLITKYGGAASHMSIRCAEFDIPAAIGCGETIYNKLLRYGSIKLDCRRKKILPTGCIN